MKEISKMVVLLLWLATGLLSDSDPRKLPEGQRTHTERVYWLVWPQKDSWCCTMQLSNLFSFPIFLKREKTASENLKLGS